MKKLVYYIGILVCISIFLSSCIAEDTSDCPVDGIVPQLVLVPYEGSTPTIINDSLFSAQVYVFDELDRFVTTYQIQGRPQLNQTYTPNWILPYGKYSYIAWVNDDAKSFKADPCVAGQSILNQTLLQLLVPQSKAIDNTGNIPFLCYGHLDNQELDSIGSNIITIPIMQFVNRINVTVTGMNYAPEPSDKYTIAITDNNGTYGFDGAFASNDMFTYSTNGQDNGDNMVASLKVLRLSGDRPNPVITINDSTTGEQLFSANLTQLILASNPNNDFDKTHVYNIVIDNLFSSDKEIPITITINDWIVDQSNNEFNIN